MDESVGPDRALNATITPLDQTGIADSVGRRRSDVAFWLRQRTRVGDLVLTACDDYLSRIIRLGTNGAYSHVAVVTSSNSVTEAYDRGMTPTEHDEGVYEISFDYLAGRGDLERIAVLRPRSVDEERLSELARRATNHSPPFASLGALLIAALGSIDWISGTGTAGGVAVTVRLREWASEWVGFIGDGVATVHCSEFATRLYLDAGMSLRFELPRLEVYIRRLHGGQNLEWEHLEKPASLEDHGPRQAWSDESTRTSVLAFARHVSAALRHRRKDRTRADWADFIMPSDFCSSSSFEPVGRLDLVNRDWIHYPGTV